MIKYDNVIALSGGALAGILFMSGLMYGLNLPEVQMSHSTGECVKVINYVESDKYTCDDLPKKYHHVWVK